MTNTLEVGSIVRFATPVDAGDDDRVMEVVEDRGSRVVVRTHPSDPAYRASNSIQPTFVYLKSELVTR